MGPVCACADAWGPRAQKHYWLLITLPFCWALILPLLWLITAAPMRWVAGKVPGLWAAAAMQEGAAVGWGNQSPWLVGGGGCEGELLK